MCEHVGVRVHVSVTDLLPSLNVHFFPDCGITTKVPIILFIVSKVPCMGGLAGGNLIRKFVGIQGWSHHGSGMRPVQL